MVGDLDAGRIPGYKINRGGLNETTIRVLVMPSTPNYYSLVMRDQALRRMEMGSQVYFKDGQILPPPYIAHISYTGEFSTTNPTFVLMNMKAIGISTRLIAGNKDNMPYVIARELARKYSRTIRKASNLNASTFFSDISGYVHWIRSYTDAICPKQPAAVLESISDQRTFGKQTEEVLAAVRAARNIPQEIVNAYMSSMIYRRGEPRNGSRRI